MGGDVLDCERRLEWHHFLDDEQRRAPVGACRALAVD